MDYTKIPKQLIYKELHSLRDFGVYDKNHYNKMIAHALYELYFKTGKYQSEECAVTCMNTAYYICTMAFLEDNPTWRLHDYYRITDPAPSRGKPKKQVKIHKNRIMHKINLDISYKMVTCFPEGYRVYWYHKGRRSREEISGTEIRSNRREKGTSA